MTINGVEVNISPRADLREANLRGADLTGANLRRANLRGADLAGANLPLFCRHDVSIIANAKIRVGCESNTPEGWEKWLSTSEIFETPRNTPEFKRIEASIRAAIAYARVMQGP